MVTKKTARTPTRKQTNNNNDLTEKDILHLPLLPIRNTVLLPNLVTPLIVEQEQSLKALEEAMKKDRILFVVTQLNEDLEDPGQDDVYTVGVEGMVDRVLKMPDGTTSVLLHGQRRLRRLEYTQQTPFIRVLAEIAASHAEAGADVVAPSSMMDGQVRAIKRAFCDRGLTTMILSYSAKHASSLYTPFRSAAYARTRSHLDKSSYQVSYANPRQVLLEIDTDINEGADMVMIKPALLYLDLVRMVKDKFSYPIAVQNVSGEYAMIKAASTSGLIDEEEWKVCSIASIKRAGADRIISYFALEVSKYL